LTLVNAREVVRVKLFDVSGREVFSAAYTGKSLNLETLSGGTYLVNTYGKSGNKPLHKFLIIKE
jgi:hypothetical protein